VNVFGPCWKESIQGDDAWGTSGTGIESTYCLRGGRNFLFVPVATKKRKRGSNGIRRDGLETVHKGESRGIRGGVRSVIGRRSG